MRLGSPTLVTGGVGSTPLGSVRSKGGSAVTGCPPADSDTSPASATGADGAGATGATGAGGMELGGDGSRSGVISKAEGRTTASSVGASGPPGCGPRAAGASEGGLWRLGRRGSPPGPSPAGLGRRGSLPGPPAAGGAGTTGGTPVGGTSTNPGRRAVPVGEGPEGAAGGWPLPGGGISAGGAGVRLARGRAGPCPGWVAWRRSGTYGLATLASDHGGEGTPGVCSSCPPLPSARAPAPAGAPGRSANRRPLVRCSGSTGAAPGSGRPAARTSRTSGSSTRAVTPPYQEWRSCTLTP
jgi:hypothetical protein